MNEKIAAAAGIVACLMLLAGYSYIITELSWTVHPYFYSAIVIPAFFAFTTFYLIVRELLGVQGEYPRYGYLVNAVAWIIIVLIYRTTSGLYDQAFRGVFKWSVFGLIAGVNWFLTWSMLHKGTGRTRTK